MKYFFYVTTLLLSLTLSGCNTVKGAGEDIKAGGEVISDSAQQVEREIKQ